MICPGGGYIDDDRLDTDSLRRGATRLGHLALLCFWPHDKPVSVCAVRSDPPGTFLCTTAEDSAEPPTFSEGIVAVMRSAGGQAHVAVFPKGDHLAFNFRENVRRWIGRRHSLAGSSA